MGDFLTPVNLGTGVTATDISAGDNFSCAITNTATVKCWGRQDNNVGQLGIAVNNTNIGDVGAEMGNSLATVDLGVGRTALEIQSGYRFTCVRMDNLAIKCWGVNNLGQLGLDDTTNRGYTGTLLSASAVNLGAGRTAKKLAVGYRHVCAILDNDTLSVGATAPRARSDMRTT